MNLFSKSNSRPKTPGEIVKTLKSQIERLKKEHNAGNAKRVGELNLDISQNLVTLRSLLEGASGPDMVQMSHEIYASNLLYDFIESLSLFEFESRKTITAIFNSLLRHQIGSRWPTVDYLVSNREIVMLTLKGYENPQIALNTGIIFGEMIKHESIARVVLYDRRFYNFLPYIEQTTFGIACDAQNNFRDILTRHKSMVAQYLEENYDTFFSNLTLLLNSTNYVTKRQSVKLLAEVLLDRTNFKTMTRYISDEENLKHIMNMLRDKSKNIQFEAFHVFKIFVANPKKAPQIVAILKRNKVRLIEYLEGFNPGKSDDQFMDEKAFLITQIRAL